MSPEPLSSLLGRTFDPVATSWNSKDTMLYAAGVGARPETELEFLFEGQGPKVLPTYGVIPGMTAMGALLGSGVEINPMMILHGEQAITLHRPIPSDCNAEVTGRISEIWDKGKAAVIGVEGIVTDADGALFTTKATLFIRGAGGFGGERGPASSSTEPPGRDPDQIVEATTREEQAAIYRLSGDRNPLHIDPSFAQMAGYEEPFIHGLCTYGFVGRAILQSLCDGDPARFTSFAARFADQVYPGDAIVTKIWRTAPGEAVVQAETQRGNVVLSQAKATFAAS